jgi:dUTP pyrophosphatase
MSRGFDRISHKQATIDGLTTAEYESIELPTRATICSAGYDLRSIRTIVVPAYDSVKVPTGLRTYMLDDEVLLVHIRSSLGFKYNVRLSNATGVIDSDYYFADNEGHIWLGIFNDSDEDFLIEAGSRVAQGIFMKYLVANDVVSTVRTGGLGSTE